MVAYSTSAAAVLRFTGVRLGSRVMKGRSTSSEVADKPSHTSWSTRCGCSGVLVVSTLYPKGPHKTLNLVEFYYPEEIAAFEREFVEAEQAAYWETCTEDDEIALRMDAGRRALMDRGDDEVGPYQSPMEDGMQQFHEWYRRAMGTAPGSVL